MMQDADFDRDGKISYQEFYIMMKLAYWGLTEIVREIHDEQRTWEQSDALTRDV